MTSFQVAVIAMKIAAIPRMVGRLAPMTPWMLVDSCVTAVPMAVVIVSISHLLSKSKT